MDATPKQMNYLRKLVAQSGQEIHAFLTERGICHLAGFREPTQVADMPSKDQASRFIDELQTALGIESRPYRPRGGYGRRRRVESFRCTHEDYPCCGCGNYSDTGMTAY
jgi:hypothetical protein